MNSNVRPSFPSMYPSYGPNFPSSNFYGNSWQDSYNPPRAMNSFPFNNQYQVFNPFTYQPQYPAENS
jgi:hypothetical protein